jgi:hypothetical protein
MMAGLLASLWQLPFFICSCVLGGFALWGWRRSGANGALLVAIGCAVRVVHELVGVYQMTRLYAGGASSYARTAMWYGAFQSVGALIADVLFIVGVALLLRRLPRKA